MADRSLRVFLTPEDADDVLEKVRSRGAIVVVRNLTVSHLGQRLTNHDQIPAGTREAYVGFSDLSSGHPADVIKNPGQHAWVRFQLPRHEKDILYMAGLDIRTRWITHNNRSGIEVYNRILKPLTRRLHRPTCVWSLIDGATDRARDVAFTDRAKALYGLGTAWMQEGVMNVRYGPGPPRSE